MFQHALALTNAHTHIRVTYRKSNYIIPNGVLGYDMLPKIMDVNQSFSTELMSVELLI